MKSSTIRRSTLSKESMEVIENLSKEQDMNEGMNEYLRADEESSQNSSKSQEIDLLWQNFKTTQFNTNSPTAYITLGFVIGVISTLLVMFCIHSFTANESSLSKKSESRVEAPAAETENEYTENSEEVNAVQTEETTGQSTEEENTGAIDTSNMTKYVVVSGDTGESIIKKHYGSYTPERAERIIQVNKLQNLDRINIDQVILLPNE